MLFLYKTRIVFPSGAETQFKMGFLVMRTHTHSTLKTQRDSFQTNKVLSQNESNSTKLPRFVSINSLRSSSLCCYCETLPCRETHNKRRGGGGGAEDKETAATAQPKQNVILFLLVQLLPISCSACCALKQVAEFATKQQQTTTT